ncbi:MAG: YjbH domain-containing protein [Bacteroidales bacterium]|nr:YjbH domain-containing protein [Bacteroidales bacterium]
MKKVLYSVIITFCLLPLIGRGQQYTGISGLVHVPSAEMHHEGDARLGIHNLNQHMLPDVGFTYKGEKYNTYDYYLAITPYSWLELSYVCTKRMDMIGGVESYHRKDRSASIKIRPLQEGKYWPAVALGCNDVGSSVSALITQNNEDVQLYFQNYYVAATKHFVFSGNEVGVTMAYRYFTRDYNAKWNGIVGGLTFRPSFFPQARAIVEYTGNEFLVGMDAVLFRHLMIQASLKDFKYPNVGLCFQMNLLGRRYKY